MRLRQIGIGGQRPPVVSGGGLRVTLPATDVAHSQVGAGRTGSQLQGALQGPGRPVQVARGGEHQPQVLVRSRSVGLLQDGAAEHPGGPGVKAGLGLAVGEPHQLPVGAAFQGRLLDLGQAAGALQ